MRFIKVLAFVLVFSFGMVFFQQNNAELAQEITLKFNLLFRSWESIPLPVYFLVLAALLIGAVCSTLFFFFERVRLGAALRKSRKQSAKLEKELNALRTQLIEEAPALPTEDVVKAEAVVESKD